MECHGREKPYQCPHCMYANPGTMKLKRHMIIIHMGSRSSKCELCHTRFAQTNTLAVHKEVHTEDVVIVPAEDQVDESKGGDASEEYEDNDVQSNVVLAEDQVEEEKESKGGDVDDGDE